MALRWNLQLKLPTEHSAQAPAGQAPPTIHPPVTFQNHDRSNQTAFGGICPVFCSIRILVRCIVHSHSKSHQMPAAMKARMSGRSSFFPHKNPAVVINEPTPHQATRFRTDDCSSVRAHIEQSGSAKHLIGKYLDPKSYVLDV